MKNINYLLIIIILFSKISFGDAQTYPPNPDVIVASFVGGPLTAPFVANYPVIISDPYNSRVDVSPYVNPTHDKKWATAGQVGSVYGIAYSPLTDKTYTSAYVKRHAQLGAGNGGNPSGFGSAGAIYALSNPPSGGGPYTVSVLLDIGAAAGTTARTPASDWTCDPAMYEVGRVGWGDIDASPDGATLWAMNLHNKSLYKINATSGAILGTYPIPGVTGGPAFDAPVTTNENLDFRPFGLKVTSDKVYVGVVSSGESLYPAGGLPDPCNSPTGYPALRGYVFEFSISGSTYSTTPVLNFPFQGASWNNGTCNNYGTGDKWSYWMPQSIITMYYGSTQHQLRSPAIADIEIDAQGNLLIGLRNITNDRLAGIPGIFYPDCTTDDGQGGYGGFGGQILKACGGPTTWTIESGGMCGGVSGFNSQVFYDYESPHSNGNYGGSIAYKTGSGEFLAPGSPGGDQGGMYFVSEATKAHAGDYNTIYSLNAYPFDPDYNPLFGKANGLGDVDLLTINTTCSLTNAGKTNELCNNNGTGTDPSDDYITFSLNPTGTNLGTGYTVTVSGGATITPTSGTYGSATNFRLQNGSANGTTYTITITDNASGTCQITTTVSQNSCSAACSLVDGGLCNVNCSNTGSDNTNTNDYIIFDLNPTGLNLSGSYNVTVNSGTVTLANGNPATGISYGSARSFRLQNGSAGGGNKTITITDASNPACTITVTITDPGSCSTTCPGAYMLGTGESYTFTTQSSNIDVNTIQWYKSTNGGVSYTAIPAAQGGTSQTITINTIGEYYYKANGLDGCPDSSCCHIILIPTNCANCQLLSAGKSNEQCNNNNTPLNGADDYITFSLNPQGSLLGSSYTVSVNNGGTITPSTGTYGTPTNFRLQNGSANGTLYTITITDNNSSTCTITTTVQQSSCASACSMTGTGKASEQCNNNGTGSSPGDDYITFTLNPTGSNLGTLYFVTVNNGGIITPSQGTYGSATTFRLQNGSANGTTYTITITDNVSPACQMTTTVSQASCSHDCQLNGAGKSNEMCNNNGTLATGSDDYITFSLNPSGLNLGSGYTVTVSGGGTVTPSSGSYGSATSFRLQNGSANGTTYTIIVTDNGSSSCTTVTTVVQQACSTCPTPDCLNVQMKKN